jgi:glycosyltransferase involved in cell wall biosynthesis
MKPRFVFVGRNQFGYHTDSYKWCESLRDSYRVTYICFDYKRPRLAMDGVKVIYVSRTLPEKLRGMMLLLTGIAHCLNPKSKIFIEYFPKCSWIKRALPWHRMCIDVRTMHVVESAADRKRLDNAMIAECRPFDIRSAISNGVIKQLGYPGMHLLPLGADVISQAPKAYDDEIRLLYVGAFNNRNIDLTIRGLKIFRDKHPEVAVTYELIGFGETYDEQLIQDTIKETVLGDVINYRGRVPYDKLKPYFDTANVGFSFVPMTDYYEHQPPTKTYEYAMSGIYSIATATQANKDIVTADNGVLIDDTAEGVAKGIEHYWLTRKSLNEANIRASLKEYSWKNICENYLRPIIDQL